MNHNVLSDKPKRVACCLAALLPLVIGQAGAGDRNESPASRQESRSPSVAQVAQAKSQDSDLPTQEKQQGDSSVNAQEQFELGYKRWENHQFPEALRHFNEAIRLNPNKAEYWDRRGRTHVDLNAPADGLKDYEQAEKLGGSTAERQGERAWACVKLNRFDRAQEAVDAG
ncbi:MAG: tetratricopeptide repeat protein, partial [Planctomycetales bacterium]